MPIAAKAPIILVKAQDTFTDREAPRKVFWNTYNMIGPGELDIINFYGVGGVGKTTLLKKIQSEMEEKRNDKYIYHNFENQSSMKAVLYILSRQMMYHNRKLKFPLFDYAFMRHCELANEDAEALAEKLSKSIFDTEVAQGISAVADTFIPFAGIAEFMAQKGFQLIKGELTRREREKADVKDIYYKIDTSDVNALFNDLPLYFAKDASVNTEKLVVMLDGYEALVNRVKDGDKAVLNDLWLRDDQGLVQSIPNVLWVIAGREMLTWPDELLPNEQKHLIGNLSDVDSAEFFRKSGIEDEVLIKQLYQLTDGTPVYMDLCVERYHTEMVKNKGEGQVSIDQFGQNTEVLAVRYLRDMSNAQQKMMYLMACLPSTWSDEMAKQVAESVQYGCYFGEYRNLLKLSLIQKSDDQYKMHETLRKVAISTMPEEERKLLFEGVQKVQTNMLSQEESVTLQQPQIEKLISNLQTQDETVTVSEAAVKTLQDKIRQCADAGDYSNACRQIDALLGKIDGMENFQAEAFDCITSKMYYLYRLGKYHESKELGEINLKKAKAELGEEHPATMRMTLQYATALVGLGEYDKEKQINEQLYETQKRVLGEEHPDTLKTLNNLGCSYSDAGEYEKARELTEKAYEGRKKVLGEEHPDTLMSLYNLAIRYANTGDKKAAKEVGEQAYELRRKVLGEEHPDTLMSMNNLAVRYSQTGEEEKALEFAERAYELRKKVLGEEHPDTLRSLYTLSIRNNKMKNYEKGLELGKKAYAVSRRILGEEHPFTTDTLDNLTYCYYYLEDKENYKETTEQIYEIFKRTLGETHPDTIGKLNDLLLCYYRENNYGKAIELGESLYTRKCQIGEKDTPENLTLVFNMGIFYRDAGNNEKAKEMTKKAYEGRKRVLGEEHEDTQIALRAFNNCCYTADNTKKGKRHLFWK